MPRDRQDTVELSELELEQARSEREALEWLQDDPAIATESEESEDIGVTREISQRAFEMIVYFEVTSKALYENRYRKPIWPGGASGVTIGIGYDVGYARGRLDNDWRGIIPNETLAKLRSVIGVTGQAAKAHADQLRSSVDVSWDSALAVHRNKVIPRWKSLVEGTLSNTDALSPDCLGAIVSLAYNRGASFRKDGDRYREMRAIGQHMASNELDRIPNELRSMKRLWPNVTGLRVRRDREAHLFEDGLSAT